MQTLTLALRRFLGATTRLGPARHFADEADPWPMMDLPAADAEPAASAEGAAVLAAEVRRCARAARQLATRCLVLAALSLIAGLVALLSPAGLTLAGRLAGGVAMLTMAIAGHVLARSRRELIAAVIVENLGDGAASPAELRRTVAAVQTALASSG